MNLLTSHRAMEKHPDHHEEPLDNANFVYGIRKKMENMLSVLIKPSEIIQHRRFNLKQIQLNFEKKLIATNEAVT